MENIKRVLSFVRRALDDYLMIEDGDKIAVGVSAGKDSLTLLCAMAEIRRFYPKKFDLLAITVDMGFEEMDFSPIKSFCEELGVEYEIVPTQISKIIFDVRKEKNPCSLCAKMRRGALYNYAKERGCNKVALGVAVGRAGRLMNRQLGLGCEVAHVLLGHIYHRSDKVYIGI